MEAGRVLRVYADARQLALVAGLLVLAVIGWLVIDERMAGMDGGPGTDPGALGFYVGVWVVMMAAMMFPSVAQAIARLAELRRRQGRFSEAAELFERVSGRRDALLGSAA